jgi:hypothetical protein
VFDLSKRKFIHYIIKNENFRFTTIISTAPDKVAAFKFKSECKPSNTLPIYLKGLSIDYLKKKIQFFFLKKKGIEIKKKIVLLK